MLPKLDLYSYFVGSAVTLSWYLVDILPKTIDKIIAKLKKYKKNVTN